jgi:cysteine desulfurase
LNEQRRYYFDWAATAPPPPVQKQFDTALLFGNPSSKHTEGRAARESLEESRRRCAAALDTDTNTTYFTSGATESNTIALFSILLRQADGIKQTLLTTTAEHPSVLQNCATLKQLGIPVYYMDTATYGGADPEILEKNLHKNTDTTMLAMMYVNNENGAVSNLNKLVETARRKSAKKLHIHIDMAQALGKLPLSLRNMDIDSASFSAHKIGGPRGIGILYLRKPLQTLCKGGGQEGGQRPGTENTAGAFYFAETLETLPVQKNYNDAVIKMAHLINALRSIDRCTINPEIRETEDPRFSPYILRASFKNAPGEVMQRLLDDEGFAVSTGSACSSAVKKHPSPKTAADSEEHDFTSIRISIGRDTQIDEIEQLIEAIHRVLRQI